MSRWTQYMTGFAVWLLVSRTTEGEGWLSAFVAASSLVVAIGFLIAAAVATIKSERPDTSAREKAMSEHLRAAIKWMDINGIYPLNWIETARFLAGEPQTDPSLERDNKEGLDDG